MIIKCFSSADFSPKRLVYKERIKNDEAIWGSSDGGHEASKVDPRLGMAPKQREIYDKKKRENLKKYREGRKDVRANVEKAIEDQLNRRNIADKISQYFDEQKDKKYKDSGGWVKWNEKYVAKMYPNENLKNAREKIMAMQRVIFKKLGVFGDPSAAIDGKIGPYTLAAMAAVTGKTAQVEVPMADRNTALAKKIKITTDKPKGNTEEKNKKKEKNIAKLETKIIRKRIEIDEKKEGVRHFRAELARNRKNARTLSYSKMFRADAQKAEQKLKSAQNVLSTLESAGRKLEDELGTAKFGSEYVVTDRKNKLEAVEKKIQSLWKKLNAYKRELPNLEAAANALNAPQYKRDLEYKKRQIAQTEQELKEKEGQSRTLKSEIRQASNRRRA